MQPKNVFILQDTPNYNPLYSLDMGYIISVIIKVTAAWEAEAVQPRLAYWSLNKLQKSFVWGLRLSD